MIKSVNSRTSDQPQRQYARALPVRDFQGYSPSQNSTGVVYLFFCLLCAFRETADYLCSLLRPLSKQSILGPKEQRGNRVILSGLCTGSDSVAIATRFQLLECVEDVVKLSRSDVMEA